MNFDFPLIKSNSLEISKRVIKRAPNAKILRAVFAARYSAPKRKLINVPGKVKSKRKIGIVKKKINFPTCLLNCLTNSKFFLEYSFLFSYRFPIFFLSA